MFDFIILLNKELVNKAKNRYYQRLYYKNNKVRFLQYRKSNAITIEKKNNTIGYIMLKIVNKNQEFKKHIIIIIKVHLVIFVKCVVI